MPLIITEVVHKFTIVVCERAVLCFKAPFIPFLSPSHVQLSCEIKRIQSGEFFPRPSEEEVERLHKVGRATSSCVHTQHQETIVLRVSVQPQGRRKYEYDSRALF